MSSMPGDIMTQSQWMVQLRVSSSHMLMLYSYYGNIFVLVARA